MRTPPEAALPSRTKRSNIRRSESLDDHGDDRTDLLGGQASLMQRDHRGHQAGPRIA